MAGTAFGYERRFDPPTAQALVIQRRVASIPSPPRLPGGFSARAYFFCSVVVTVNFLNSQMIHRLHPKFSKTTFHCSESDPRKQASPSLFLFILRGGDLGKLGPIAYTLNMFWVLVDGDIIFLKQPQIFERLYRL